MRYQLHRLLAHTHQRRQDHRCPASCLQYLSFRNFPIMNKIDAQLYDPVEDGRHIVTMDLPKKIKIGDLEKGVVYEFTFDQHKAPLSKKVSEYLQKEKEIDMDAIYQFELKSLELLDVGSESADDDEEE